MWNTMLPAATSRKSYFYHNDQSQDHKVIDVDVVWKDIISEVCIFRDWILLVCFSWRYEAIEVPRVNFVMREALFEIYTWILCRFIPSWETNK